jgi:hypothetical protein
MVRKSEHSDPEANEEIRSASSQPEIASLTGAVCLNALARVAYNELSHVARRISINAITPLPNPSESSARNGDSRPALGRRGMRSADGW